MHGTTTRSTVARAATVDPKLPYPARPDIPNEFACADSLAAWIERSGGDLRVSHVSVRGDAAAGADFVLLELGESAWRDARL